MVSSLNVLDARNIPEVSRKVDLCCTKTILEKIFLALFALRNLSIRDIISFSGPEFQDTYPLQIFDQVP
jgi:hypothetical protein